MADTPADPLAAPLIPGGLPPDVPAPPFEVTITRSDGRDGAVVIFIDGPFGIGENAPLRIIVNDEQHPVHAQVDHEPWEATDGQSWIREAEEITVTVCPPDITYTGFTS
jgi:hypothetical protein